MIINNANLEALRTGFKTTFQAGLKAGASLYALLATVVTSSTKVETYGFLGELPRFRKWIGDKRIRSIAEKAYQLTNESFEATIGIHKDKIRDDNLGLYGPMVNGWGKSAGQLNDQLVFDALRDGHLKPCYDGQNFFDTDHPVGDGGDVYSNMTDGAGPAWYLVDCSQAIKPILLQERQAPTFDMVTDMTDSHVFKTGEYLMGGEARAAAGYTYPQLAHRSKAVLNAANFQAARDAMAALVDDEGQPLEVRPTHIIVGSSNLAAAKAIFEAQNQAGGASNIWWKAVEVVEAKRLA